MSVTLHIGLPKTGTTALQNWARINAAALARDGIFVLPTVLEGHRLAVESISNERRLQDRDIAHIRSRSFDEARTALLAGLQTGATPRALVSSEYFYICEPARVAEMFTAMGVTVGQVLCFVRRQDDLLASGYNQDIKGLGRSESYVPPGYLRTYDWMMLREDWQSAFPHAAIRLRNFDHHRRHRTLIEAYARDIGASGVHLVPAASNTNESICAELLEIVRVANGKGLGGIAALAVKAQDGGLGGTPFAFAEPVRRAILAHYAEANRKIAAADDTGEFADFARDGADENPGIDLTGSFPAEFCLQLLQWAIDHAGEGGAPRAGGGHRK